MAAKFLSKMKNGGCIMRIMRNFTLIEGNPRKIKKVRWKGKNGKKETAKRKICRWNMEAVPNQ